MACWPRMYMKTKYIRDNYVLVGHGDGGLGPRFRGDDGRWGWPRICMEVGYFHCNDGG